MITDPYGNEITTGIRVAFNLSGQVAIGQVIDIKQIKDGWNKRKRYVLIINRETRFEREKSPHYHMILKPSKVHHENVCVLPNQTPISNSYSEKGGL